MNYRITLVGAQTYSCRALNPTTMKKGESRTVSKELKDQLMQDTYTAAGGEQKSYFTAIAVSGVDPALDLDKTEVESDENPDAAVDEVPATPHTRTTRKAK